MLFGSVHTESGTVLHVYMDTPINDQCAASALTHLIQRGAGGGAFIPDNSPEARGCLRLHQEGLVHGELEECDPNGVYYTPNSDRVRIQRQKGNV